MTPRGSVHLPHGQVEVECGRVVSVACGTYFWEKCQSVQYIGDILGGNPIFAPFISATQVSTPRPVPIKQMLYY